MVTEAVAPGEGAVRATRAGLGHWSTAGEVRLVAMLVGIGAGAAVGWSTPDRLTAAGTPNPRWVIFLVLGTILGAVSGEAFGFGVARWRDLAAEHGVRIWRVVPTVAAALLVATGLIAAAPFVLGGTGLTHRGVANAVIAILGGLPAAATMSAVHRVARQPLTGTPGHQLGTLLHLRRVVSRLLNQLGLLVVLVTAVNASAVGWGSHRLDSNVVVYTGAVASLIVGVMCVPAVTTLRRRAAIFIDQHFGMVDTPLAELVDRAEERGRLEKLLGTDRTTFDEMKTGLVVLTPFVVSALAALFKP